MRRIRNPITIPTFVLAALALAAAAAATAPAPGVVYEAAIDGYLLSGRWLDVDAAGGAVVGGRFIGDTNENNILVARFGPDGAHLWTMTIEGADHDYLGGLALDDAGDVYLAGWTDSQDFPLVGFGPPMGSFREAFLAKLDGDDGTILFTRLFGGEYTDMAYDLALNAAGEPVVVGSTISRDFPVVGAVQDELNSYPYDSSDFFVTRFSPDGATILASTFLGGTTDDVATDVALDGLGRIVVSGYSLSTDFPVADALQPAFAGGRRDLVVARLGADGGSLDFATYLGGSGNETPGGLAVAPDGGIYVAGATGSVDLPTTAGTLQPDFVGEINGCEIPFGGTFNCDDGFLFRLAPDGRSIAWGTHLAGTGVDEITDVAADAAGRAHVAGYTYSPDFPDNDGDAGIFAMRFSPDGSMLTSAFVTFSGSANAGHGIAVGADGDTYLTGATGVPAGLYLVRLGHPRSLAGVGGDRGRTLVRMLPGSPNPFRPRTSVRFALPAAGRVRLDVYDVRGRHVRTLADRALPAGEHAVPWNGRDDHGRAVAEGVYLTRLRWGGETATGRLVRLR